MKPDHLTSLPAELCEIEPHEIMSVFERPTLIEIKGRREPPLYVSTLLHGNETTSFYVLQDLARRFSQSPPPRSLMIFVGNVEATAQNLRHLEGQPDYNRIWAGGETPEHALAADVTARARAANIFASIDIHNNTGVNPLYGCVNRLEPEHLALAALFSRIGVYYRNPKTAQSVAFSKFCPAVTLECAKSGNAEGVKRAVDFVEDVLHIDHLPERKPAAGDHMLFETVGRVVIDPERTFSFGEDGADLVLNRDLETKNFSPLPAGALWGRSHCTQSPLQVLDEEGRDLTSRFFSFDGEIIQQTRPLIPAMITADKRVIRQDCLGYVMEPVARR